MGWKFFDVVKFDHGPLIQGQMRIAKLRSAYISFIIGPRSSKCETIVQKIMGVDSTDVVRFNLGPLIHGHKRIAKFKSAYNSLVIGPRGLQCETNL